MKSTASLVPPALLALAVFACSPGDGQSPPAASTSGPGSDQDTSALANDSVAGFPGGAGPKVLQALGEEVYAVGQIDSARVLFERALTAAHASGDSAAIAEALTWLAQAAWRLGDYQETRRMGEEALALKLRLRLSEELFRSYNVLGLLAWNQSRLLDAAELFERATEAATASGDSVDLAKVRNNLALVHVSLGEFAEARRGFLAAKALAHALDEPLIEGRVLINLGMLSTEVGDPLAAVAQVQEARPLLRAAEDPIGELSALGHLGTAFTALGESGRAVACLDSALQQARAQGLRQEEASNLEQLAGIHSDVGNLRRALDLLRDAEKINAELGLTDELATDLIDEAKIHGGLGNPELALERAREALEIHRDIGAPLREIEDLVVLAELSQTADRHEEALASLAEAEGMAERLGARTGRVVVTLGRARVAEKAGTPRLVLRALDEARRDLAQGGYDLEWEVHALRARAHADLGSLEQAADEGRLAIGAIERVRRRFSSGVLRDVYLKERAATYGNQVTVLLQLGRLEEAFETADAARGRAILESVAAAGSSVPAQDPGLVPSLADGDRMLRQIEELTRTLGELQELEAEEGANEELQAQTARLFTELEELRSEYAAALVRAEEHDPRGMALLGGKRPETAEITGALEPGEALLEYLVQPDVVLLFLATPEGVRRFETPLSRERLAGRVRVAKEALGAPEGGPDAGRVALQRLYEVLLAPAIRAGALSGVSRLIIVPHAELSYLPFPALRDADGRYLVEDFVLTHLPNAAGLPAFRNRDTRPPAKSILAVTAFAPFPQSLPGSVLELEAIEDVVGDVRTYRESNASEARFRDALRTSEVIHAATHGVMNAYNPMFSRLELAREPENRARGETVLGMRPEQNGRFEVHEILRVSVAAPLVFLSGCETAAGSGWSTTFGRGEEYATLAQAFLHAGAENVIATLWRIDDPGAAVFSRHFYSELHGGRPPAQALAAAQRAMLRDPEFQSPFYWAAYRLMGPGDGLPGARTEGSVR